MSKVFLEPVRSAIYSETDLEPQMIQQRTLNQGHIYLNSSDAVLERDKTNMLMSSIARSGDKPNILAQGIKRLRIMEVGISWVTPNVNPRNNVLSFYSSNTGSTKHTVVIIEGFYNTQLALINEIVTRLNTLTGTTGLTFSQIVVPLTGGKKYTLTSSGGSFYFDLDSLAVKQGSTCYCFEPTQNLASSKSVGPMLLTYTSYIDFCSTRLNSYNKLPSRSTGKNSNIIYRAFYDTDIILEPTGSVGTQRPYIQAGINFLYSDGLSTIDFQLKDQWGQFFYVPANSNCFQWDMNIVTEF